MNRLDYYRAVALGAVIGMSFLILFYLVTGVVSVEVQTPEPKTNFTVVDTYKGCHVIQWTNSLLAEHKYFLYCNNTRPEYGLND